MASWYELIVLLLVVGAYAGPVTTQTENVIAGNSDPTEAVSSSLASSSYDDLTNHTTAVVEFVLQNLHRLKNYQERERLERLVTRFKTLVDQLGSHQLQNNINSRKTENDAQETSGPDVKYPFSRNQLSQNDMMLKDKQLEKNQQHRGRLSITLLPRGEEPSRKLQLSRQAESTTPTAAAMTTTTTNIQELTSQPLASKPEGGKSKNLQEVVAEEDEEEEEESTESDEPDAHDDEVDRDDELVEELHQTSYQLADPTGSKQEDSLSENHSPNLNDDQLIELNDKRYNPLPGNQVETEGLARAWDSAEGTTQKDQNMKLLTDDDDDTDFIDPTDHDDSHQLDDDVKLLSKVISNLRQVKEVLRRMRVGEEHTR